MKGIIENQKAIIEDYVKNHFPGSTLTFFEDRDRSGYTFEQREGYREMRRGLMSHKYDILIVKDFSRFSRRNSRGLVELEDLRDAGVRIISIGDNIDFPNDDDWLKIQFQFLINEMPVTDTSKKVRSVVKRRQEEGRWLCAAPYGYILNKQLPSSTKVVLNADDLICSGLFPNNKDRTYFGVSADRPENGAATDEALRDIVYCPKCGAKDQYGDNCEACSSVYTPTELKNPYSILTGALTLTLMVLPLITRNTQEALKTVPATYRSGALGIGATKWYMIRTILLPSAMPGIITGIILAIGRIVGESAALLFTAGSGYLLPKTFAGFFKKIFESGGTLTIQLYLSMSKAQYDAAFGIAAVLLIIVLFINLLTKILAKKFDASKLD